MPAEKRPEKTIQFRDFSGGLNRTDARTGIKDTQVFWNENVQPIGSGQQVITPPRGPILASLGRPNIFSMWGVNIRIAGAEVKRLIIISGDGAITVFDPVNITAALIAAPNTVTAECRLTVWEDGPVLFADPVVGYFIWDGTTFQQLPRSFPGDTASGSPIITNIPSTLGLVPGMHVSGAGIPVGTTILTVDTATQITLTNNATATATGVTLTVGAGAPTSCRDVAVFEGRVWLIVGLRSIQFSAPGSYTDFSIADGAGTTTIPDSVFVGKIERLLSALEVLWIVGASAVNSISNVQAAGSPVITTFSNTNIVANVGTVRPSSVAAFFRTFLFLAPYGVYAIVGATPQKLSDTLDGLFPFIKQTADQVSPAAIFSLNRVFLWTVLVTYIDPAQGERPVLLCFAKNAWFIASQGDDLTYITGLVDPDTGVQELWGCNSTGGVFQCFAGTDPGPYLWQTKLWDFGAFTQMKKSIRMAFEFFSDSGAAIDADVSLESELGTQALTMEIVNNNQVIWIGDNGLVLVFIGDNGLDIVWTTAGFTLSRADTNGFSGHYIAFRIEGESLPYTLSALALNYDPAGEWT